MHCVAGFAGWLRTYEYIAIWLEGIALVAIFVLDWYTRREEHRETIAHMDIARKQIHSDRVAEIWHALRAFAHFVARGQVDGRLGPGRDYFKPGGAGLLEGRIFLEYLGLQEAYYLSYLVSDPLAAYMKERMDEADELQRVAGKEEFDRKLQEFHKNWNVYEMAQKIRDLS